MTAADMQDPTIEAAADHIAHTENLARPVRDGVARLLRAAAYEFDRGRSLPLRLTFALRDITAAVNTQAGYQDGDHLSSP